MNDVTRFLSAAEHGGRATPAPEEDWTYSKAWLHRQWFRGEPEQEAPE
jgi:hypothetical protein